MKIKIILIIVLSLSLFCNVCANQNEQEASRSRAISVIEALRQLALQLNITIKTSSAIKGRTTMALPSQHAAEDLALLIATHHLVRINLNNVVYVMPNEEAIQYKNEEIKWHTVQDNASPIEQAIVEVQFAKANELITILKQNAKHILSSRGRLAADVRSNVILIADIKKNILTIEKLIRKLDKPLKQIRIEARLVSVDTDLEKEIGFQFISELSRDKQVLNPHLYNIAILKLPNHTLLDVKLALLEKCGKVELLSRPSLFTASLKPAYIEAGEEIPYQQVSEYGYTSVIFKKAVLRLKVTPQLLPKNNVLLDVEVNQDRPSSRLVQGLPTISTRQMMTHVLLKNGQTVVLGGIFEKNQENIEQRVPWLSQLPVIGYLFRQDNKRINKRELFIFITPTIVNY